MKRRLVLIRHAKSSWSNPLQSDYDRPLNERGQTDAPMMGERLKAKGVIPDMIIASTAKRASETAKIIANAVDYDEQKINWQDKLYHCNSSVFDEMLEDIPDTVQTVFIVAHNPGVSEYASAFEANSPIDQMPTCGIAGVEFDTDHWYDFNHTKRQVFLFDYPKKNG